MKRFWFHFLTIFTILTCSYSSDLFCQQSINSGGANISSPQGQISLSLGQLTYKLDSNSNVNISCGVQQVYELSAPSFVDEVPNVILHLFPNPMQNIVNIEFDFNQSECYYFEVFSSKGQLFQIGEIAPFRTQLDVSFLASGSYILTVKKENGSLVKSFIINKI
jgi:hypothetical protein